MSSRDSSENRNTSFQSTREGSYVSMSNVASCNSAEVDGVGIRGFLYMRQDMPSYHRMKRHYYRMMGVNVLRFASIDASRDLSNATFEAEIHQVETWDGKGLFHRYQHAFKLHTSLGVFNVYAESKEDKTAWVEVANHAIVASSKAMTDLNECDGDKYEHVLDLSPGGMDILVPHEKPPVFKNNSTCMHNTCTINFEISRRRPHHCRNCGNTVCSEHGSKFMKLEHYSFSKAVRVCVSCSRVQRYIQLMQAITQTYITQRNGSFPSPDLTETDMETRDRLQELTMDVDFGVSDALQELHLHRKSCDEVYAIIVEKLVVLSETNAEDFEFFLPQIFHIWATTDVLTNIAKSALLSQILMTAARKHIRMAQLIYWHTRAAIDDSCGTGFGQSERSIHPALNRRFPLYKLMLINIETLVAGSSWKFTPDDDLMAQPAQCRIIQTLFNRICALQDHDALHFRRRSDTLGNICSAVMASGMPWAVTSSKSEEDREKETEDPAYKAYRSDFFKSQLDFMKQLADIAESLRHVQPPSERKHHLPDALSSLSIPKFAFFPLGLCSEKLARIVNIPSNEGTVFSTRARAPTLIYFELLRSSVDLDCTLWHQQESGNSPTSPMVFSATPNSVKRTESYIPPDHASLSNIIAVEMSGTSQRNENREGNSEEDTFKECMDSVNAMLQGENHHHHSISSMHEEGLAISECNGNEPKAGDSLDCIIDATWSDEYSSPRRKKGGRDVEGLTTEQLQNIANAMQTSFSSTQRTKSITEEGYSTFTGKEAVLWMIKNAAAIDDVHAVWVGKHMLNIGLLRSINETNAFSNDSNLYTVMDTMRKHAKSSPTPRRVPKVFSMLSGASSVVSDKGTSRNTCLMSPHVNKRTHFHISDDEESIKSTVITEIQLPSIFDRFNPEEAMGVLSDIKKQLSALHLEKEEPREKIISNVKALEEQMEVICEHVITRRNQKQLAMASMFGERFETKIRRIQQASTYGRMDGWDCVPVIVKSFDDLRQEVFCLQLIRQFQDIFDQSGLNLKLLPYAIVATSASTGFIEVIKDACSLDALKRRPAYTTLGNHFQRTYGGEASPGYVTAMQNFVRSMAAYSLACYFLQIKDRHNGNIMIDADGHLVHIDFGFILGIAPGTFSRLL